MVLPEIVCARASPLFDRMQRMRPLASAWLALVLCNAAGILASLLLLQHPNVFKYDFNGLVALAAWAVFVWLPWWRRTGAQRLICGDAFFPTFAALYIGEALVKVRIIDIFVKQARVAGLGVFGTLFVGTSAGSAAGSWLALVDGRSLEHVQPGVSIATVFVDACVLMLGGDVRVLFVLQSAQFVAQAVVDYGALATEVKRD